MITNNTFICKCGQWNRSPAPNFGRLICWNCGSAIVSVARNVSGTILRGQPVGSAKTAPPATARGGSEGMAQHSAGTPQIGIILTLLVVVAGLAAALSPKQPATSPKDVVLKLPPMQTYVPAEKLPTMPLPSPPPYVNPIPIDPIHHATFCYKDKHGRQHCETPGADPSAPTNPPRAQQVAPTPQPPVAQPKTIDAKTAPLPLPPPNTGIILNAFRRRQVAPLSIEVPPGSGYFIKVVSVATARDN
jgi:hypothetical protein